MLQANGLVSASAARLEKLKSKHHKLSQTIEKEQNRFILSDQEIAQLKREKLYLKEEIEGIRKAS